MLADRFRDRHEDHARLLQLGLEGGGDRDRIEHGVDGDPAGKPLAAGHLFVEFARLALAAHAGENLLLFERNAELLVRAQNLGVDLVERGERFALGRRIVIEILIVDLGIGHARPVRLAHGQPALEGLEPPRQHPLRLVLLGGDETNGAFIEALGGLFGFDVGDEPIFVLINVDAFDLLDGLTYGRHSSLRSRLQGPRVGLSRLWC